MMRIRILLVALAAVSGTATGAGFPVVIKAYEAELAGLRLPGNSNGTLSFKACSTCEYLTVRVTAATVYQADGRSYTLADFRNTLEALADGHTAVTVKHHLESDTITSIRVTTY